jgi:hypothetical protein
MTTGCLGGILRIIIRFSIDNDNGQLTTNLRNLLEGYGITLSPANTATYGSENIGEPQIAAAMEDFWELIAGYQGNGTLDHFWMYTDQ